MRAAFGTLMAAAVVWAPDAGELARLLSYPAFAGIFVRPEVRLSGRCCLSAQDELSV